MASGDLLITLSRVGSFRAGRHGALPLSKSETEYMADRPDEAAANVVSFAAMSEQLPLKTGSDDARSI
jgi:hypothetical protein